MTLSGTNLVNLSDTELIKLYRSEVEKVNKDKIFNFLLYRERQDGKSWHKNIKTHISKEIKKFYFCNFIDEDDLYQIVLKKFHDTIVKNFDVNSNFCFSTYVWWAIQSSINRVIQEFLTKKRKNEMNKAENVDIDEFDSISQSQNFGFIKTLEKKIGYDEVLFYRELIRKIKNDLSVEDDDNINDKILRTELIYLIKHNEDNFYYLNEISKRYKLSMEEIRGKIGVLRANLERRLFIDLIHLYEHGVRDDEILTYKYKCTKNFVSKARKHMNEKMKEKIQTELNLTTADIFN